MAELAVKQAVPARAWRIALTASVVGAIGLLMPLGDHPQWQEVMNLAHIPLFGGLAWAWLRALRELGLSLRRSVLLVGMIGVAIAGLSELVQFWIPGRWPDWSDFQRDLAGLAAGMGIAAHWPRR